jgi:hypothetical protein
MSARNTSTLCSLNRGNLGPTKKMAPTELGAVGAFKFRKIAPGTS